MSTHDEYLSNHPTPEHEGYWEIIDAGLDTIDETERYAIRLLLRTSQPLSKDTIESVGLVSLSIEQADSLVGYADDEDGEHVSYDLLTPYEVQVILEQTAPRYPTFNNEFMEFLYSYKPGDPIDTSDFFTENAHRTSPSRIRFEAAFPDLYARLQAIAEESGGTLKEFYDAIKADPVKLALFTVGDNLLQRCIRPHDGQYQLAFLRALSDGDVPQSYDAVTQDYDYPAERLIVRNLVAQ